MAHDLMENTLLRGKVRILQPKKGFRAAIDTVFLAAFAPVKAGSRVLDIGCGVGSAGFCVMAREPDIELHGVEAQEKLAEIATRNAALNGAEGKCTFFNENILQNKLVKDNFYHLTLMNPPYQEGGTHCPSPLENKAMSHGEEAGGASLTDWVRYAHRKLKQGGGLAMIHRADRLDDVIVALAAKRWFGSLEVLPLHSYAGEKAKRVLVRARKERYAPLVLLPGMVIHHADGGYTAEAGAVLSEGKGI